LWRTLPRAGKVISLAIHDGSTALRFWRTIRSTPTVTVCSIRAAGGTAFFQQLTLTIFAVSSQIIGTGLEQPLR
jgi:hypothetical protein